MYCGAGEMGTDASWLSMENDQRRCAVCGESRTHGPKRRDEETYRKATRLVPTQLESDKSRVVRPGLSHDPGIQQEPSGFYPLLGTDPDRQGTAQAHDLEEATATRSGGDQSLAPSGAQHAA